jgi:outer membrane lipoprotein-sorting protein
MNRNTIAKAVVVFFWVALTCQAAEQPKTSGCPETCPKPEASCKTDPNNKADPVDTALRRLNEKTLALKSYQAKVEYRFTQPLLESRALRKGVLYFVKSEKKSKLRMNFETLKQDDEKEQKYIEQFVFDGTWLTQIDYQIKAVKKYQLAEPNQPTDAFDLASRNLPIVGFSRVEDLTKQFEIELVEQDQEKPQDYIRLHLKVKPDSIHKDNYTRVDFWIDKKLGLPAKIAAVSTEEDIYEIKLLAPKVNQPIDEKVFDFEIPKGFGEPEIVPLKKKGK